MESCLEFLETFNEARENSADAPLFRLLRELHDVQRGRRSPLFEPVQGRNRSTSTAGAALKGFAACALDARHRAGETIPTAAQAIAARFVGVPLTRGGDERRSSVTAETVAQWRKDARKGELTPPEAQARWNAYAARAARQDREAAAWRVVAEGIEHSILALLAAEPRSFTLSGSAQDDARDKRSGVAPAKATPRRRRAGE